jgi:hypothetical protein
MRTGILSLLPTLLLPSGSAFAQVPEGGEFLVSTETAWANRWPAVTTAVDGRFVVVWEAEDDTGINVVARRYDAAGQALGAELEISQGHVPPRSEAPSVSSAADGSFVAAWEDNRGGIFARRYDAAGVPLGSDFLVNSYVGMLNIFSEDAGVASAADGRFVVVWCDPVGDDSGIFARRYDTSGNPVGPQFRVNTVTTGEPQRPAVAGAADGSFVVVWERYGLGAEAGGFMRRYDSSGNPVGDPSPIGTGRKSRLSVAMSPSGQFVVAWEDQENNDGIKGQLYDVSGSPVGVEFGVNTDSAANSPSVAMGVDGSFVVAWDHHENFEVYARRYDGAGNAVAPGFRVNTFTTGFQGTPAVAAGPDGRFVVVWEGTRPPDYTSNIWAQRYRADEIFADGFE